MEARARRSKVFPLSVSNMIFLPGKGECGITDYTVARACRVSRIAQIQQMRREVMFACRNHQSAIGVPPHACS